jgi:hypothetical protein
MKHTLTATLLLSLALTGCSSLPTTMPKTVTSVEDVKDCRHTGTATFRLRNGKLFPEDMKKHMFEKEKHTDTLLLRGVTEHSTSVLGMGYTCNAIDLRKR